MCYKEAFTLQTNLGMPEGRPSFVSLRKGTIMFLATLAALFVIAASAPDSTTATPDLNETILTKSLAILQDMLDEADAPAGFYPRSKDAGPLPVGTWVWANVGDLGPCAHDWPYPTVADTCFDRSGGYERARIIKVSEYGYVGEFGDKDLDIERYIDLQTYEPGEEYLYTILFEPRNGYMIQWDRVLAEYEGYNLPLEVATFSRYYINLNW